MPELLVSYCSSRREGVVERYTSGSIWKAPESVAPTSELIFRLGAQRARRILHRLAALGTRRADCSMSAVYGIPPRYAHDNGFDVNGSSPSKSGYLPLHGRRLCNGAARWCGERVGGEKFARSPSITEARF